jgi:hypothetical protein
MEKERRKEMQSMRTTESQELGNTVAQEMEKKRKLAELKKLQAKAKAAQRVSSVSSDESEDDEQAKLKTKAPVSVRLHRPAGNSLRIPNPRHPGLACASCWRLGAPLARARASRMVDSCHAGVARTHAPGLLHAETAQMVAKKSVEEEDAEGEARKKRQRQAAQRRRGGRLGI